MGYHLRKFRCVSIVIIVSIVSDVSLNMNVREELLSRECILSLYNIGDSRSARSPCDVLHEVFLGGRWKSSKKITTSSSKCRTYSDDDQSRAPTVRGRKICTNPQSPRLALVLNPTNRRLRKRRKRCSFIWSDWSRPNSSAPIQNRVHDGLPHHLSFSKFRSTMMISISLISQ